MLAESEEKDLQEAEAQAKPQGMAECNPCYESNLGPNPHYPYKAPKTIPNYTTEGTTTTYKGPVKTDADVAAPAAPAAPALAQANCNPCYESNLGPNPHYPYKGTKEVPNYSSAGGTTTYKGPVKSDADLPPPAAAAPPALAQTNCNPCYVSNAGPNTHWDYPGNAQSVPFGKTVAAPAAAAGGAAPAAPAAPALAQTNCNPCYVSNAGPNTHWDYPGNAKAVPFGTTVAAPAAAAGGAAPAAPAAPALT